MTLKNLHTLGKNGPKIPALGLGCMALGDYYGPIPSLEQGQAVLMKALKAGAIHWDTSDVYANGKNEELLGTVLKDPEVRAKVFLATKFGGTITDGRPRIRGDYAYVREACNASLKRLQVDYIDLYYQHRVDRTVPIEETWKALSELKKEGKVKYLGISEATPEEVRRAHAIIPLSAYQLEV
ncbi:Aldo/keto reductase, partial [Atractiella rhizophila]